jgi:hypothetical protein
MHIHVAGGGGEAKFWIEPAIELAQNHGMSDMELAAANRHIQEREDDIRKAWKQHFGR